MKKLQTEVLVIGGGATGTGVVRDLAMRGFKTILVEKGDLTAGTTGRYHGLLHSGGRYVVKDPVAARECIEENRILRRIMPFCIEDTGGFFVLTPWDDPDYVPRFVEGCLTAGIPVEEISISQMLKEEPLLNKRITRCFRVPDAAADSFVGADANVESARQYGAEIRRYHRVEELLQEGERVVGARCHDILLDEEVLISADMVVNASGAWAGMIAETIGIPVHIIPGKGTMIAVNHRILNTVVNRCKMPADGDIIVPAHTVAVIGTTDVPVKDPDHFAIEPWEVELMLEEGDKLVPGFRTMRMLRAWAGVRPLYREANVSDTRDVSRAYVLLDHAGRDGVEGLVTITSGKWTTYRKMAEATVDLVCQKLGVVRECRTHLEELPEPAYLGHRTPASQRRTGDDRWATVPEESTPSPAGEMPPVHGSEAHRVHGFHELGVRLYEVEKSLAYGDLICECELATVADVTTSILEGEAKTIDDVRRDVRLGMGPCQGGFCTYRIAGILQELRKSDVNAANVALRDFLQERWKGLLPILWGQQLRQERLDELIYLSVLNADHLPGPERSRLGSVPYEEPGEVETIEPEAVRHSKPEESLLSGPQTPPSGGHIPADVLVVGAGLAGLAAAWQTSRRGLRTRLIAKGWGALYWNAGCVDVLGYYPIDQAAPAESPLEALEHLVVAEPQHPYAILGIDRIGEAIEVFQEFCAQAGYPMHGSLERNWLLPSAVGASRPTCLAPETMIAGDLRQKDPMLIVGFEHYTDFYPDWTAANLAEQGIPAEGVVLELALLTERTFINARELAWMFDDPEFRIQVVAALKRKLASRNGVHLSRIGFPAVLGLDRPLEAKRDLEEKLGLPVFEIPTIPASIPGIRLSKLLIREIERNGGRVFDGMEVTSCESAEGRITNLRSEAAVRTRSNRARNFVLATGGILGGDVVAEYNGSAHEVACGLPLHFPTSREDWLRRDFLTPAGHPIYRSGIFVNKDFQPVNHHGQVLYDNLWAVGTGLAYGEYLRERSFDGIGLATGYAVGASISKGENPSK